MDDEFIVPYGCYECSSVVPIIGDGTHCPVCGSTAIHSMQDVLETALEHRRQMSDLGLDDYEGYDE